jgi:antirestriction protein ArdC
MKVLLFLLAACTFLGVQGCSVYLALHQPSSKDLLVLKNETSQEAVVAELGSAFLCADLGITLEIREDHADYIGHWLKVLQDDTHAIFQAAAHAQRAADYLQGLQSPASPSDSPSSP